MKKLCLVLEAATGSTFSLPRTLDAPPAVKQERRLDSFKREIIYSEDSHEAEKVAAAKQAIG
jgi:hypothetical protein